jgi:hypothetical protein
MKKYFKFFTALPELLYLTMIASPLVAMEQKPFSFSRVPSLQQQASAVVGATVSRKNIQEVFSLLVGVTPLAYDILFECYYRKPQVRSPFFSLYSMAILQWASNHQDIADRIVLKMQQKDLFLNKPFYNENIKNKLQKLLEKNTKYNLAHKELQKKISERTRTWDRFTGWLVTSYKLLHKKRNDQEAKDTCAKKFAKLKLPLDLLLNNPDRRTTLSCCLSFWPCESEIIIMEIILNAFNNSDPYAYEHQQYCSALVNQGDHLRLPVFYKIIQDGQGHYLWRHTLNKFIPLLFRHGASPTLRLQDGRTIIHSLVLRDKARWNSEKKSIKIIFDELANKLDPDGFLALINCPDNRERTPLFCALEQGHQHMANHLIEQGAWDKESFIYACKTGNTSIVAHMIEAKQPNIDITFLNKALNMTVRLNNKELSEILITNGAWTDQFFIYACRKKYSIIVKIMIDARPQGIPQELLQKALTRTLRSSSKGAWDGVDTLKQLMKAGAQETEDISKLLEDKGLTDFFTKYVQDQSNNTRGKKRPFSSIS